MTGSGAPNPARPAPGDPPPAGLRLLCLWFVVRFGLDAWTITETWGTAAMSPPKLGIAILLLPLAILVWRQHLWAVCLAGMLCLFWLGFAAARTLGLLMQGAEPGSPYPWTNWLALPALFYLLHYAQRFTDPARPRPRGD